MNAKAEETRLEGEVIEAFPSAMFKVRLDSGREVLAYLAGKMRMYRIKILVGDRVVVEFTPYDQNRGRIVYRK
jgi:translation initiation factor IF-1